MLLFVSGFWKVKTYRSVWTWNEPSNPIQQVQIHHRNVVWNPPWTRRRRRIGSLISYESSSTLSPLSLNPNDDDNESIELMMDNWTIICCKIWMQRKISEKSQTRRFFFPKNLTNVTVDSSCPRQPDNRQKVYCMIVTCDNFSIARDWWAPQIENIAKTIISNSKIYLFV